MGKIAYFFSSIIDPIKIRRFKNMTIFFALLIFVIEFWIILLPAKVYLEERSEFTASIYDYTDGLYNLSQINQNNNLISSNFNDMKAKGYKIKDGKIEASDNDITVFEFVYTYNEINYCIYFVYDIKDSLDEEIAKLLTTYYNLYPSEIKIDGEVESRIMRICELAYHAKLMENKDVTETFNTYHDLKDEEIASALIVIPYYEFYGIKGKSSNKNYGYCFTESSVIRSKEGERDVYSYSFLEFDINDYNNMGDFSKDLSVQMVKKYNERLYALQTFYCVLYVLLLPMIFVLIIFLFTRKYGKLRSILEFYNIASLASIFPAIITAILVFVIGPQARNIYMFLFILYTLFMLVKAATSDKEKPIK